MFKLLHNQAFGLLVIRLVIGLMFIYHGFPKLAGGVDRWQSLGGAMSFLGITFFPAFWGFMAAMAEFLGGLALVLGFFTRLACFFLACTMLVAFIFHLGRGDGFSVASHALELLGVSAGLLMVGPGGISLDGLIKKVGPWPL